MPDRPRPGIRGVTLLEVAICIGVIASLSVLLVPAGWKVYERSAIAVSAGNLRQLAAGGQAYLAENDHRFWPFCEKGATDASGQRGSRWWFGFESDASLARGEGERDFDPAQGPLAGYVPKSLRPDPSLALHGGALKPKYRAGYLGIGYNAVLSGGWVGSRRSPPMSFWQLPEPARVAVFAMCAQVNTFQSPASTSHPKIEDFYGFDQNERTIHFRNAGTALVAFADGSCGWLPLDESTRDPRMKEANIGRFAPRGSFLYLK